jgi:hypothetical protein
LRKYITTHGTAGSKFSNGFIISNREDHSLRHFRELLDEARRDFPGLSEDDVECRTVTQSHWCEGYPAIRFSLPAGASAEGYTPCESLPDAYVG